MKKNLIILGLVVIVAAGLSACSDAGEGKTVPKGTPPGQTPAGQPGTPGAQPGAQPGGVQDSQVVGNWSGNGALQDGATELLNFTGTLKLQANGQYEVDALLADNQIKGKGTYTADGKKVQFKPEGQTEVQVTPYEFKAGNNNGKKILVLHVAVQAQDGSAVPVSLFFAKAEAAAGVAALAIEGGGVGAALNAMSATADDNSAALVGVWNYNTLLVDGTDQTAPMYGTLTLTADGKFDDNAGFSSDELTRSQGTYSVSGNVITITTSNGSAQLTYDLGQAEKDGVKRPALLVHTKGDDGTAYTMVLIKQ